MNEMTTHLNELAAGLFIIAALGIVATRQIRSCLRFFISQSVFLAASALLLGVSSGSPHLLAVAAVNILSKALLIPWILGRLLKDEVYTRREITQVVTVPMSLIIALALVIASYFATLPWLGAIDAAGPARVNLPIGLGGLFLGAYALSNRREAVPQLLGLLAMENGAFFAGVAIAPDLPFIAELAVAFDALVVVLVVGVLTRKVHERTGSTIVGAMANLREGERR